MRFMRAPPARSRGKVEQLVERGNAAVGPGVVGFVQVEPDKVAAAGEAPAGHAGGAGGADAVQAVLQHQAAGGLGAHRGGGMQEQVGRRLAAGDHRGGVEPAADKAVEAGRSPALRTARAGTGRGGDAPRHPHRRPAPWRRRASPSAGPRRRRAGGRDSRPRTDRAARRRSASGFRTAPPDRTGRGNAGSRRPRSIATP